MLNEGSEQSSHHIATVIALDGRTETELLELVAAAPGFARFPQFESSTPVGLCGPLDGQVIAIGNSQYFAALGLSTRHLRDWPERVRTHGQHVLFVAVNGQTIGLLGIETPLPAVSEA